MRLFYPTDLPQLPEDPTQWTPWHLDDQYAEGMARYTAPLPPLRPVITSLMNWQTRGSVVPSVWGAEPLARRMPVVVFSHGLTANRGMYSSVCSQLASHGFFVAAVEHRDGSGCGSFTLSEDGAKEWLPHELVARGSTDYSLRHAQVQTRVKECSRALDVLERLDRGDASLSNLLEAPLSLEGLKGRLNLRAPVIAGHSFGAATALLTLAREQRFSMAVALDPWMFPLREEQETLAGLDRPTVCVSTEAFQTKQNLAVMDNLPKETSQFITIKGTVHQNQCDTPFVLGRAGRWFAGASSELEPGLAMDLNNALALSFIASHFVPMGVDLLPDVEAALQTVRSLLETNRGLLVRSLHGKASTMLGWDEDNWFTNAFYRLL